MVNPYLHFTRGNKECTPLPWDPSSLGLLPDPDVAEQKSHGVYHLLGKQEKIVYTIGPERGVYATQPQTPKKKKNEGFYSGGVYFFLPCLSVSILSVLRFSLVSCVCFC